MSPDLASRFARIALGPELPEAAFVARFGEFLPKLYYPLRVGSHYNILPVALLELGDRNAVIKAQAPTALIMLAANIALMYFLAFR